MTFPKNLLYSETHEWVLFAEDGTATIGITDYAQDQLGDLVFVNLPEPGFNPFSFKKSHVHTQNLQMYKIYFIIYYNW